MSYYFWNWSKSLCGAVGVVGVVCKPILVFSLAQAEQLMYANYVIFKPYSAWGGGGMCPSNVSITKFFKNCPMTAIARRCFTGSRYILKKGKEKGVD